MASAANNQFAYNYIESINADRLGGFLPGFFMPLNKSVFGDFDFNGGWLNNGLSIIGGDLYAQTLFVFNITSLNVTQQNLTITDNLVIEGDLDLGFTDGSIVFAFMSFFFLSAISFFNSSIDTIFIYPPYICVTSFN